MGDEVDGRGYGSVGSRRGFSAQRSAKGAASGEGGDYNQIEMLKLAEEMRRNQLSKMNYRIQ